jgi:RNA-binding protein 25
VASPPSPVAAPLSPSAAAGAINLSLAPVARKRASAAVPSGTPAAAQVFSLEEEQAQWVPRKKRELVKLDGAAAAAPSAADLAALAEKVPTSREALYAWTIDWAAFDEAEVLEKRLRPWIVKKVIEYVSEEDPILRDFILTKLRQHTPPAELETALVDVLDADASPFVQKLWRLLAFELLRLGATK